MKRLFWDTNLFIYLIEAIAPFDQEVRQLIQKMRNEESQLITSALTICETLVLPVRKQDQELIASYQGLFSEIEIISIEADMAPTFAALRAQTGIKTPDALQITAAICGHTQAFITNDERLEAYSSETLPIYSLKNYLNS